MKRGREKEARREEVGQEGGKRMGDGVWEERGDSDEEREREGGIGRI